MDVVIDDNRRRYAPLPNSISDGRATTGRIGIPRRTAARSTAWVSTSYPSIQSPRARLSARSPVTSVFFKIGEPAGIQTRSCNAQKMGVVQDIPVLRWRGAKSQQDTEVLHYAGSASGRGS